MEVVLLVADERWLTRLMLRLAPHATVVSPAGVRRHVHGRRTAGAQPVRLTGGYC